MNATELPIESTNGTRLFSIIAKQIPSMGGWTSVPKAQTFAAVILALRPEVCVEIGVWEGRGSVAIALALKEIGRGTLYSIDAWNAAASVEGQVHPADVAHWRVADHEGAYGKFVSKLQELNLQNCVKVIRARSEDVEPPSNIGFAVIDGNHGPAVITDVRRFAPKVKTGGFVYMDDRDWSGGNCRKAETELKAMGFTELYPIENGAMYQRA